MTHTHASAFFEYTALHRLSILTRLWTSPRRSISTTVSRQSSYEMRRLMLSVEAVATDVCRDLVLHDTAESNQFRQLIPMAHEHPVLLQTIIAGSAMRMAHTFHRHRRGVTSSNSPPCSNKFYRDALTAKQRAYKLLRVATDPIHQTDSDVILAAIVLLIEVELIDVGRNNWKHHIQGATNVIEKLCGRDFSHVGTMSSLQKFLMSNCLIFEIIGSTTSGPLGRFSTQSTEGFLSLLQDAEGNHCSSFPTQLLQILQTGASLVPANAAITPRHFLQGARMEAWTLFDAAYFFDPCAWAIALQHRSPVADLEQRVHVASAHKAAVCIYIARLLLLLGPAEELPADMAILLSTGIDHLSQVGEKSPFFAATAWTSFVVGAEMVDSERRSWAVERFNKLWEVEPWGSLREAITVLQLLWEEQDEMILSNQVRCHDDAQVHFNWIRRLRDLNVHWLVI